MTVTHLRQEHIPWAVCGDDTGFFSEVPTCLGCAVGTWLSLDSRDQRLLEYVSTKIAGATALPPTYLYGFTGTSNSVEIKPDQQHITTCNTLEIV